MKLGRLSVNWWVDWAVWSSKIHMRQFAHCCGQVSQFHIYSLSQGQGGFDGRGQPTASPMLTAIMSGGVGISGRKLYKYR